MIDYYQILPPLVTNIIVIVILLVILNRSNQSKDDYFVNMAILERIINDYVTIVVNNKVDQLQKDHDLNPESKVNSIKLYEIKVNELISKSVIEIIKLLSIDTRKYFKKKFTNQALGLLITNHIKQNF